MNKTFRELYPNAVTIYTVTQSIINNRLVKPDGQQDTYFPDTKRREFKVSPNRKVFQTEDRKEYLAKKKEWLQEYQNDRNSKKAAAKESKTPIFLNEKIAEIVNVLFEKQKKSIINQLNNIYDSNLKILKSLEGFSNFSKEVEAKISRYDMTLKRMYEWMMEVPGKSSWGIHDLKYLKSNHKNIMQKFIEEDLENIMSAFLLKMQIKLCDTIKNKEIKEFESEGMHSGWVSFLFADGSKFMMENSIEWGRSKYGVHFQRFPCRFKNVIFADGSRMKGPSEEKMKKEF